MIHLALLGCGGMASWHAERILKVPELKVVALVDSTPARATSFREKYFPDAEPYLTYENLFAKPPAQLNAILIMTPHTLHYAHAKQALEAGLDVMLEKPMVTRLEDAYDLWRTVKRTGRKLAITFQAPYSAEFRYLKGLRDSGQLGTPQIIQGWLAQGWMKLTEGTWRQDPSLSGGGQMYDAGAHVLNGMMWLMDNPVVEVFCLTDNLGTPVDINGVACMRFENGALGSVAIGGNSGGWLTRISLQTDRLQVVTGAHGGFLEITNAPEFKYPAVPTSTDPFAFTPHRNFADAVLGRDTLLCPVRYGVLLSALMDALYESVETRRPVKVKPVPRDLD
ncbi:MAG: Gfo/Idh/MocA family oxidoreductase [Tepidisphaeraceae bacterium]